MLVCCVLYICIVLYLLFIYVHVKKVLFIYCTCQVCMRAPVGMHICVCVGKMSVLLSTHCVYMVMSVCVWCMCL